MEVSENTYCTTYGIPAEIVTFTDDVLPTREELDRGLEWLKSQSLQPKFGDLIEFLGNSGYRNDGITIYDGEKIIDLSSAEFPSD